jgi:hypothetical protein
MPTIILNSLTSSLIRNISLGQSKRTNYEVANNTEDGVNQGKYQHYQPKVNRFLAFLIVSYPLVALDKRHVTNPKEKNVPVLKPTKEPTNKPPKRNDCNGKYY